MIVNCRNWHTTLDNRIQTKHTSNTTNKICLAHESNINYHLETLGSAQSIFRINIEFIFKASFPGQRQTGRNNLFT